MQYLLFNFYFTIFNFNFFILIIVLKGCHTQHTHQTLKILGKHIQKVATTITSGTRVYQIQAPNYKTNVYFYQCCHMFLRGSGIYKIYQT